MNKYGQAAIKAVELIRTNQVNVPQEAWKFATGSIFDENSSSQKKGCPKSAFLGLCEEGKVKGIDAGKYTTSQKNKEYALKALEILKNDSSFILDRHKLWNSVLDGVKKSHNSQMDVVIALWEKGLINGQ